MVCFGYTVVNTSRKHKDDNKYDNDDNKYDNDDNNLKYLYLVSYLNQRNNFLQINFFSSILFHILILSHYYEEVKTIHEFE